MAENNYTGAERRKYLRLDLNEDCTVSYIKLAEGLKLADTDINSAYSKNISAGGILFIARENIPLSMNLELQIKIPLVDRMICALGKVVRSEEKSPGTYRVAVSFEWINPKDVVLIDRYVMKNTEDNKQGRGI